MICIAVAALWVFSLRSPVWAFFNRPTITPMNHNLYPWVNYSEVSMTDGTIAYGRTRSSDAPAKFPTGKWQWEYHPSQKYPYGAPSFDNTQHWRFKFLRSTSVYSFFDGQPVTYWRTLVVVRAWAVMLAASILPALWVRSFMARRRRQKAGTCPACGYDLRATPDRCPECGRAAGNGTIPVHDRADSG